MNLLDKLKSTGALFLGLIFFISCEELGEFGLGEEDIAPLEFLTTDISPTGGLVLIDSILSGGTGTIMMGERQSEFGKMEAKAHSAFFLDLNDLIRPRGEAVLDSVKLNFSVNYLFERSDFNQNVNMKAYQVLKSFPDTVYVTSSFLPSTDIVIAQENLTISDVDSVYSLQVDPAWADEVFEGLKDASDVRFNDLEEFRAFFPGLIFTSDDPMNNIIGMSPGAGLEIRFYFSEPASDGSGLIENREIFINGEFSPNFYSLSVDRSGTEYSQVEDPKIEYPIVDKMLVHSGAGVVTKFDLAELREFSDTNENIIVNLVELTIGPIEEPSEGVNPPSSILLYFTDDQNTTIDDRGSFRGIQQDGVNVLSSGFPVRLLYDSESRTYNNSITSYVQSYYTEIFRRDFLFIYPADMNVSANGFELDPELINIEIFYSELR